MVSTVTHVDLGGASEFRVNHDQRTLEHSRLLKIVEQHAERLVEFAELLQVEVEVLGVRVVPVVGDLDDSSSVFEQCASQKAIASKRMPPVTVEVFARRFPFKEVATSHQFLGHFEGRVVRIGKCFLPTATREPLVEPLQQASTANRCVGGDGFRPDQIGGDFGAGQLQLPVASVQKSVGVVGKSSSGHVQVARQRGVVGHQVLGRHRPDIREPPTASSHLHEQSAVVVAVGLEVDATHDGHQMHPLCGVRQQFTDVHSRN